MPRGKKSVLSVSDLERMLKDTNRQIAQLERQKASHEKDIGRLDAKIAALRGTAAQRTTGPATAGAKTRRGGRRSRRTKPLKDMIVDVLAAGDTPMRPKEIADAVQQAGYKTKSKNFLTIVNNTLSQDKRVSRKGQGLYTVDRRAVGKATKKATKKTTKKAAKKKPAAKRAKAKKVKTPATKRTRGKRSGQPSLEQAAVQVLKESGEPMRPAEVAKAVLASGYESKSKYFPNMVSQALRKSDQVAKADNRRYKIK